jgi:hypothetical protein
MSWVRFDDGFFDREEIIGLSDAAYRLYTGCIFWSGRTLSDGRLSRQAVRSVAALASTDDVDAVTEELVGAGLWTAKLEGFLIVSWEEFLRPKADVERCREEARLRMRDLRARRSSRERSREGSAERSPERSRGSSVTPTRGSSGTSPATPPQKAASAGQNGLPNDARQYATTVLPLVPEVDRRYDLASRDFSVQLTDDQVDQLLALAADVAASAADEQAR